ncbi:MAG: sugar phosphate isomerase/epimerase [Spirochaetes bacterium]|nr:sugar phosphate isomerase/epimerase [Spirochaetota bacterium]
MVKIGFQTSKYNELSIIQELDYSNKYRLKNFEIFLDNSLPSNFSKHELETIIKYKKRGLEYSVHSPIYSYIKKEDYIDEVIKFCIDIKAAYLTVHFNQLSYEIIEYLIKNLKKTDLSIENVIPDGHSLYDINYIDFMKICSEKYKVYSTLDIGHCVINGYDPIEYSELLSQNDIKVLSVHLHNNDKISDTHQSLEKGLIDYQSVIPHLIKKVRSDYYVIEHWSGNERSLKYFLDIINYNKLL